MKAFPPPLTAQEEAYYLKQASEGNLHARHILIEHNLRLVAHILKKYQYLNEDPQELLSIGMVGLVKAVNTFNPRKGSRLATYAAKCTENEILMLLRSRKKLSRELSLYEPIGTDKEGNEIQLFDILQNEQDETCRQTILKENVHTLYRKLEAELTKREQLVLKMRYGLYGSMEHTQREVASRLNISRSYVSRIEKGAIEKLRKFFPD